MQYAYDLIQTNPEYFALGFVLVNVLWVLFAYLNKQRHDKALANLARNLKLEAERRKTIFELKVAQYESYVNNLDEFGRKHQVDIPSRMQPIFKKYLRDIMEASELQNKEKTKDVIVWFCDQITTLMQEGLNDVLKLQSESNRLKLTATDEMIETFNRLEYLTKESMEKTNEFMQRFIEINLSQNDDAIDNYLLTSKKIGLAMKTEAEKLMKQMRNELAQI